jgi:microcystin-dependent protein
VPEASHRIAVAQQSVGLAEVLCRNFTKFDSSGKALRSAPNADLLAGVLIQGTPYVVTYNNGDGAWYLKNFYGNPYNVPLGAGLDYWGLTAPNSSFVFPIGQAISRTTYAALFAMIGTTYGSGDGTTTFNLPDKTGRVSAMKEAAPSRLTSAYFGGNSAILGAVGGSENHTLTTAEMPSHTHNAVSTDAGHTHSENLPVSGPGSSFPNSGDGVPSATFMSPKPSTDVAHASITTTLDNQGGGSAHPIVQPTIVCNYIIRVL